MRTTRFWNNLHQVRSNGKPNNLNFGSNKTKGPKQDSQNQLRSPTCMPEGGEPKFLLVFTLFKNSKFQYSNSIIRPVTRFTK